MVANGVPVDPRSPAGKTPGDGGANCGRSAAVRREQGGFWVGFSAAFFYRIGWLSGRPRFEGLGNIPREGGALVVANHISHIDPIYSGLAVHLARRVPRFLAKNGLWNVPLLGTVLRSTEQIPVFPSAR